MKTVTEIYADADQAIVDQICEMAKGRWMYQNEVAEKLDVKESWLCRFMDRHEAKFVGRKDCPQFVTDRIQRRKWRARWG